MVFDVGNPLAAIYSWANGVKRRMSNPLETIAMGLQRGTEDLLQAADNSDIAMGRNGMNSVLVSPEQRAQAARAAADFGSNMGLGAATVWHGSPHKFDRFDSSKIGTGEGAQAYGHGLYLAESPGVAKSYQKKLATLNPGVIPPSGGAPTLQTWQMPDAATMATSAVRNAGGDVDHAIRYLTSTIRVNPKAKDAVDYLKRGGAMVELPKVVGDSGHFYKVDIPDEAIAKMLDWDKPLSQQAPEVQKAFGKVVDRDIANETGWQKLTGEQALRAVIERAGVKGGGEQILRKSGIPGIRYLDGGSRGAGDGTRNYVVFPGNESLLTILERNGVPIK